MDGVSVTYYEGEEARAMFVRYWLVPMAPEWELAPIN